MRAVPEKKICGSLTALFVYPHTRRFFFLLVYAFYALNVPGVDLMFEYTLLIYKTNVKFMLLLCTGKL